MYLLAVQTNSTFADQWPEVKSWFNIIDSTKVCLPPFQSIAFRIYLSSIMTSASCAVARIRRDPEMMAKAERRVFAEKQLWGSTKSVVGQSRSYVLLMRKKRKKVEI
jgi:hypothetical protein